MATRVEVKIEDQTYYKCSDCESTLAYSDSKCPNCNAQIVGTDKRGR